MLQKRHRTGEGDETSGFWNTTVKQFYHLGEVVTCRELGGLWAPADRAKASGADKTVNVVKYTILSLAD